MKFEGKAFKYGDNVDTDAIIPARYLTASEPDWLAAHCMEDLNANFLKDKEPGDMIVAGENFGCGSSREHAPIAIKAAGISCVVARSFARIFYRNAINIGLPIVVCPEASKEAERGHRLTIDLAKGEILNQTLNRVYEFKALPDFAREIISAGGLLPFVLRRR